VMHRAGRRCGVKVTLLGVDLCSALARAACDSGTTSVCGDGLSLPFRSRSVDLVVCSQLLHHFADDDAVRLLGELDRVARHRVIVCDLRRSRIAAGGFWLASHPLGFHPVTRHDGVASVRRGFTAAELTRLVHAATRREPATRRSLGFRLAVSWRPERRTGR
jgi:ubiquinone/menaquinone biosynthesis C-methylase UbiE